MERLDFDDFDDEGEESPAPLDAEVEETAEIAILPPDSGEVRLRDSAQKLLADATALTISSQEDANRAVTLGKFCRDAKKALDEKRLELTKPLRDAIEKYNARIKPYVETLDRAMQAISPRLIAWETALKEKARQEEEERRKLEQEALKKAQELSAQGKIVEARETIQEMAQTLPPVLEPVKSRGAVGGVASTRKVWKFRLLKLADVPLEYHMLDDKKVGALVRSGTREIPGIEIYSEDSLSYR